MSWAELDIIEQATRKQRAALHRCLAVYVANPELVSQFSKDDADAVLAICAKHAACVSRVACIGVDDSEKRR